MIGNLIGFVLVIGVVTAVGWITRSVIAALAGGVALAVLVLSAVVVQIGSDLGSILDYAAEPKAPVLVVFSDGSTAVAGLWVKLREMRATTELMTQLGSKDPAIRMKARDTMVQRFAPDLVEQKVDGPPPPVLIHRLVASGLESFDPPALKRLADRIREHGWTEAAKGSFRLIRVDISGARAVLEDHAAVPFTVPTATGPVVAQIKPEFVLDCVVAPDCYDRLMAAVRDPDRAVTQVGETQALSQVLAEHPELARQLETEASYIPPGGYANAASSVMVLALAGRTVADTGLTALEPLLSTQPIEIFPKTPIARLLDRTLALATKGPVAKLLQSVVLDRIKKLAS